MGGRRGRRSAVVEEEVLVVVEEEGHLITWDSHVGLRGFHRALGLEQMRLEAIEG